MHKFVLLIMSEPMDMSAVTPDQMQATMDAYMAYSKRLRDEGRFVDGAGLDDSGKVLRQGPGGVTVTDGPYTESKELLGGFYSFTAKDWDEAVSIAKDCPVLSRGGGVELRREMDY